MMIKNSVNGFCYNVNMGTIGMRIPKYHMEKPRRNKFVSNRMQIDDYDDEEVENEKFEESSSSSNNNSNENDDMNFFEQVDTIPDLSWRVEKLRLEEANKRRFLKSKPKFLPYEECRKWVAAWNRWDSEEEWRSWIDDGEKRNSYIPARPDEYYGRLGKWKGWDHFLGKSGDDSDCDTNNKDDVDDANDFQ